MPLRRTVFFDARFLFVFVPCKNKKSVDSEKVYLFDTTLSSPRKCFMLSGTQTLDARMPTASNLFLACRPNELKFFKIGFGSVKPFVFDFTFKLRERVAGIETFHKNSNIAVAHCLTGQRESVIFILNVVTRKVINTIHPQITNVSGFAISSLNIVTIISKKPEIYLFGFGDSEIQVCDIDSSEFKVQLAREGAHAWAFREDSGVDGVVKFYSQEKSGKLKFLALTEEGITMINLD